MTTISLVLNILSSFLYFVSICFNASGVYLITTKRLSNSRTLLVNLAAVEIVLSATKLLFNFLRLFPVAGGFSIVLKFATTSWMLYYFAMYYLTIDRLIGVVYPLKYKLMITKRRLNWAILSKWLLVLFTRISFSLSNEWYHYIFKKFTPITFDVIFLILCAVTYGSILVKILASRRLRESQRDDTARRPRFDINRNRKFFKSVALIIVSSILLIFIPDVFFHIYPLRNLIVFEGLNVVWAFALILDPIIYIFWQDDLKLLLKRKIGIIKRETAPVYEDTAL